MNGKIEEKSTSDEMYNCLLRIYQAFEENRKGLDAFDNAKTVLQKYAKEKKIIFEPNDYDVGR